MIRIAVLGHVGNGNLGDEASFAAVVSNIRRRLPNAELVGFTQYPTDTQRRHGIAAFPLHRAFSTATVNPTGAGTVSTRVSFAQALKDRVRQVPGLFALLRRCRHFGTILAHTAREVPFLFQSYRHLSSVSLVLIAGSQQLSEIKGGAWWFPYTIFKWTLLARLRGIPVAVVSVGAGPLESRMSRWFVRMTLAMVTYSSFRDETSRECVKALRGAKPGPLVPDLAFSLPSDQQFSVTPANVVAINPMPTFLWRDYDPATEQALYTNYLTAVGSFSEWLLDRGYRVAFLATQLRPGGDPAAIRDLMERLSRSRPESIQRGDAFVHSVEGMDDLMRGLTMASVVVATRFHGAVLACHVGRPVLAIAAKPHVRDMMDQLGQSAFVVSAETLDDRELKTAFLALERDRDALADSLEKRLGAIRPMLAAQYDALVTLAVRRQAAHASLPQRKHA
jgi:polysaccharide pyruvyl transferase WcaK-like protein